MIKSAACLLAAALAATACSTTDPGPTATVTRTRSPAAPTGTAASSSAPSTSAATPTATPTRLAGTCDTLVPAYDVAHAIGARLPGGTAFVVGRPDPAIGRLAYLNCRYGVTGRGSAAVSKVEIGISLYATPERAAARITATREDYGAHGATGRDVPVRGLAGRLLTGGTGAGYTAPLLVVASGPRTVAVSIDPSVASGDRVREYAVALADLTLERTGG